MLLTGGVIGPLAMTIIGGLVCGMADIIVDILSGVWSTVAIAVAIILEGLASLSCGIKVRTGTVCDTGVSIFVWVGVILDVLVDALARTVNGVVPDVGVSADVDAIMWVTMVAAFGIVTSLVPL